MTHALTLWQGFWRLFRTEGLALGAVTLLAGLFLAFNAATTLPLIVGGVETRGTVTIQSAQSRLCSTDNCPNNVPRGQTYYNVRLAYGFTTPSGSAVQFHQTRSQRFRPDTGSSRAVTITYLSSRPQNARPGTRAMMVRELGFLLALTGLGLAALLGVAGWRLVQTRRAFDLATRGTARTAIVVWTPSGLRGPAAKALHWTLPDRRAGHSLPLAGDAPRPKPGDRITVLDDGKHSAWADQIAPSRCRAAMA